MPVITHPEADKNKTILCIEDSPDNRLLVRRILEAEGYHFVEAGDASTALGLIAMHTPDLILMDINMPDIDGYTLTARLRSMPDTKHVPILAMTANAMKGDRERSLAAGCDSYIEKPIDVDRLPKQVSQFLALRG
jgi:two-component system, cell cycle response regulator DivK